MLIYLCRVANKDSFYNLVVDLSSYEKMVTVTGTIGLGML